MGTRPRRRARCAVLEALYAYESSEPGQREKAAADTLASSIEEYRLDGPAREFAEQLLARITEHCAELDWTIRAALQNWELSRVAVIDRNILRMGLAEFAYFPDIPPKVTIDEAIELAKIYSTSASGKFVNGILDRIKQDLEI